MLEILILVLVDNSSSLDSTAAEKKFKISVINPSNWKEFCIAKD